MTAVVNTGLLLVYVSLSAYGLYLLKAAPRILSETFFIGFLLYGTGFLLWLWILMRLPLSVAFPTAAGSLILATLLVGHFLLGEPITPLHAIGALAILAGIIVIFVFAK